jgi:hypothetical protein
VQPLLIALLEVEGYLDGIGKDILVTFILILLHFSITNTSFFILRHSHEQIKIMLTESNANLSTTVYDYEK